MSRGDPLVSPWVWNAVDYTDVLGISISVAFNNSTRALQSATVHRDTGCQYHTIVFDVPGSGREKFLDAPADGAGDVTYTAQQMKRQGLNTIDDVLALQITAD